MVGIGRGTTRRRGGEGCTLPTEGDMSALCNSQEGIMRPTHPPTHTHVCPLP